jgi:hypothetical protein
MTGACGPYNLGGSATEMLWEPHAYIYTYLWVLLVHGQVAAMLRFVGSMSNLPLLTNRWYQYHTHDKMMERKMVTDPGYGMGISACNRLCSVATGHSLVTLFSLFVLIEDRPFVEGSQVTNLLSRAHTCLWEQEGSLLSYRGFRLFLDWLIRDGERWRSKHRTEIGSQVWGLGVQVWMGTWTHRQEWNGLVLFVLRIQARRVFLGYPAGLHWFMNHRFYVTVRHGYGLAP